MSVSIVLSLSWLGCSVWNIAAPIKAATIIRPVAIVRFFLFIVIPVSQE